MGHAWAQVVATDIDHNSPSVFVVFDKERYLFNAGEGVQRQFRENKIKIAKVRGVAARPCACSVRCRWRPRMHAACSTGTHAWGRHACGEQCAVCGVRLAG